MIVFIEFLLCLIEKLLSFSFACPEVMPSELVFLCPYGNFQGNCVENCMFLGSPIALFKSSPNSMMSTRSEFGRKRSKRKKKRAQLKMWK